MKLVQCKRSPRPLSESCFTRAMLHLSRVATAEMTWPFSGMLFQALRFDAIGIGHGSYRSLFCHERVLLLFDAEGEMDLNLLSCWHLHAQEANRDATWNTNLRDILHRRSSEHSLSKDNLAALLTAFAHTDCTDARDKVYAFLSLAQDTEHGVKADYTKPAADLYFDIRDARLGNVAFELGLRRSMRLKESDLRKSPRYHGFDSIDLTLRVRYGKGYSRKKA